MAGISPVPAPLPPSNAPVGEDDAPASGIVTEEAGSPFDEGAPIGPSEGEESAFLVEQREQGLSAPAASPARTAKADPEEKTPLPPLDDLVNRIPQATRDLLDELFRAKFVTVKRVPSSALKN